MLEMLDGVRVIDLTTVVLGPFATQMLGDLGADVIKVESPTGDIFREIPPTRHAGMGAGFLNLNRNKRSICIDLKNAGGLAVLRRLVAEADVLIHNMRPAAARRLGITYECLREVNARLVYCAAVGFGSDGPYANKPAYDDIVQAGSGMASLMTDENGAPRFMPTVAADKIAALFAEQGILAALYRREQTGKGAAIEAPMFESLSAFILAEHMAERVFDARFGRVGYLRLFSPNRRPYKTADGYLAVMPYTKRHWQSFLMLIGREDIARAEWVLDNGRRSGRIDELYGLIGKVMPERSTKNWIDLLEAEDIPCGRVNNLDDLFDDPHLQKTGFFQSTAHPTEGEIINTRFPLTVTSSHTTVPDKHAPKLGEHSKEILNEYGFTEVEIENALNAHAVFSD